MDHGFDKKIEKTDFERLIKESTCQSREERAKQEKKEKRERIYHYLYDFLKLILGPVVIASMSFIVTAKINEQQVENTRKLNEQQLESAHIIAEANRQQSFKIASSNQQIERLKHIKGIFQNILEQQEDEENINLIKMQIVSLEIYKEDALVFLLNIKTHYEEMGDCPTCSELVKEANKSILNILKNSQIDVSGSRFEEWNEKDRKYNMINLRNKKYINFNFSGCIFRHVNLYQADFSDCTLKDAEFDNVDLYRASFSGSNLSRAIFRSANLRKANFESTQLNDVRFVDAIKNQNDDICKEDEERCRNTCQLEGALFSFGSLLKTDELPFKEIKADIYVNLLLPHRQRIKKMAEATASSDQKKNLQKIVEKAGCHNFQELNKLLQLETSKSQIYSAAVIQTPSTSGQVQLQQSELSVS